jgi:hypothetical protein
MMVKSPSLVSETVGADMLLIRTRALAVASCVIVQAALPVLGTLESSTLQVEPPSRESSTRTLPVIPEEVQRIVRSTPAPGHGPQISPPFGETTVIAAGAVAVNLRPVLAVEKSSEGGLKL